MARALTIHIDNFPALNDLDDVELALLIRALMLNTNDEDHQKLPRHLEIIYGYITRQNARFSEKQALNGIKGGAPKGNLNSKKTTQTTQTTQGRENNPNNPTESVTVTNTETIKDQKEKEDCAKLPAEAGPSRQPANGRNNLDDRERPEWAEPRSAVSATQQPIITLTLNDKSEYPIYEKQRQEWSGLYPAVDVMQQLRGMRGWLMANPNQRKTKRGILSFVDRWLKREQDKGGKVLPNSQNQKQQPKPGRFVNFDQREIDFAELERLDNEYLKQYAEE